MTGSKLAPERLFRRLAAAGRPSTPVAARLPGAEGAALGVRAPTEAERLDASDAEDGVAELVALVLVTLPSGERVFTSGEQVRDLPAPVAQRIALVVLEALERVAPAITDALLDDLDRGASHPSNRRLAYNMWETEDVAIGMRGYRTPRPDRYYGAPVCNLTSGQILAYRAACRAIEKQQQK